jgi:DNA recombination protein RmuC
MTQTVLIGLTLLVVLAAAVLSAFALWTSRLTLRVLREQESRKDAAQDRIAQAEATLADLFQRASADMAQRLENTKGELQQKTSDQLTNGFQAIQDKVNAQLESGRREQAEALAKQTSGLEEKLARMSDTQSRGLSESRQEISKRLTESREEMTKALSQTTRNLEERFESLSGRVTQTLETLRTKVDERLLAISDQVQKKLDQNIKEGFSQFEKVQEHLKATEERLKEVGQVGASIHDLNTLLKMPHLRGRFGEVTLERILADFLPAGMYELQGSITSGDRLRPDALILLPDRIKLPIDSKFPREQVLALFESDDPAKIKEARANLATIVKQQAADIAAKYIKPEDGTTDLALMFLPSETLWFEVIRNTALSEALAKLRVFPVSPNTLMVVLHSMLLSYNWYQMAKGYESSIQELRKAMKSLDDFRKRFEDLGKRLEQAQSSYQTASTHLGRYQNRVTQITGEEPPEIEGPDLFSQPDKEC